MSRERYSPEEFRECCDRIHEQNYTEQEFIRMVAGYVLDEKGLMEQNTQLQSDLADARKLAEHYRKLYLEEMEKLL